MRRPTRNLVPFVVLAALLIVPMTVTARPLEATKSFNHSRNLQPIGHSFRGNSISPFTANSDLAFQGKLAFQGHYDGFRVVDISSPANPREISFTECKGSQGDVVVYGDVLVRSWDAPTPAGGSVCDGQAVAPGWEGVHVFDISDVNDPKLVATVETECGSHTATLAPDPANNRVIVYNNISAGCDFIDVIEVPLANPAGTHVLRLEPLDGPFTPGVSVGCHDMGVILGKVNLAACASADGANVFDIGANQFPGGSLEDPQFLYTIREPGVGDRTQGSGRWHSASFTWDGKVIVLGHEPAGGAGPRCTQTGTALPGGVTQTDTHKTAFFYEATTGKKLGQFTLPRAQTVDENCTIHNYNVVPLRGRYLLVHGSYQSGVSVVDFTDTRFPREIAFADPAPLSPTQLGGDWSTYWYNGRIYESDITRGLTVWRLNDPATGGARHLDRLNPQTQDFDLS